MSSARGLVYFSRHLTRPHRRTFSVIVNSALAAGLVAAGACRSEPSERRVESREQVSVRPAPIPSSPPAAPSAEPPPPGAPSLDAPPPGAVQRAVVRREPASDQAARFVVLAGGDVGLGRGLGQRILRDAAAVRPFAELAPYFAPADLRFVNLECQLSDQGGETQSPEVPLKFTGPPAGADVLARSGVDLVSLANNHVWDYGKPAFLETLDHLERAGVAYVGASREPGRMFEPTVIRKHGWSLAWFAVTHIWNQGAIGSHPGKDFVAWGDAGKLVPRIIAARRDHDAVIVSYHGGAEYVEYPMTWSQDFARAVIRAGADAIIGHHPHVPLGVGWVERRPTLYSLGNLVFPMHSEHPWTGIGFLARLTFYRTGELAVEACPYHILGETPMPFEEETRAARQNAFRGHLKRLSVAVGRTEISEAGPDGCFLLSPPPSDARPGAAASPQRPAAVAGSMAGKAGPVTTLPAASGSSPRSGGPSDRRVAAEP